MKTLKTTILYTLAFMAIVLAFILAQSYFNDPLRGCEQFDAGTTYTGYHCKDGDRYTIN